MAPFFAPFWSHFGSQVRHYTPFGRPDGQHRLTKHSQKKRGKKGDILGAGREVRHGGGRGVTPLCLLTFGLKTEVSLERGAISGFPEYLFR